MLKFRVLKIKLIIVEFFGKIKLKVIINNNNNINSLCVVCELVCLFRRVCMRVLEAKRESASFVSIFFFCSFRLLYLPHLLCLERAPHFLRSLHPLPFLYKQHHLIITQKSIKFVVCCVAISPIFVRTAGSAGISI